MNRKYTDDRASLVWHWLVVVHSNLFLPWAIETDVSILEFGHIHRHWRQKGFQSKIKTKWQTVYVLMRRHCIWTALCIRETERQFAFGTKKYTKERITKTRLFKYIENFTSKNWKFSDKKLWYFSYFCSKHRLWVLVRTASVRRF